MRKLFLLIIIVLTALAALVAFAAEVPETVVIDGCKVKKSAVEFPHKAHFELAACVDCHHTAEGLTAETVADMEVDHCALCHAEPENAETPNCTDSSSKTNPYHILCVGCHKDTVKEKADSPAPTKCTACHPKEDA